MAAFGQAGEAALSAAQTALQARTRQAELRAAIASAQIRAEADGVVGAFMLPKAPSPGKAACWDGSWNRAAAWLPPDARRSWEM